MSVNTIAPAARRWPWRHRAPRAACALLLGAALSARAMALALGPIEVQSTLGAPLSATVPLGHATQQEADGLELGQASAALYQQAGHARSAALDDLRITLVRQPDGALRADLRGHLPVREPRIDLLLVARTSTTAFRRHYTLLLDPPSATGPASAAAGPAARPAAPIRPAAASAPAAQRPPRQIADAPRPDSPKTPAAAPSPGGPGSDGQPRPIPAGSAAGEPPAAPAPAPATPPPGAVAPAASPALAPAPAASGSTAPPTEPARAQAGGASAPPPGIATPAPAPQPPASSWQRMGDHLPGGPASAILLAVLLAVLAVIRAWRRQRNASMQDDGDPHHAAIDDMPADPAPGAAEGRPLPAASGLPKQAPSAELPWEDVQAPAQAMDRAASFHAPPGAGRPASPPDSPPGLDVHPDDAAPVARAAPDPAALDFFAPEPPAERPDAFQPLAEATPAHRPQDLDFDLSTLAFDLPPESPARPGDAAGAAQDMPTRLALAEEFARAGDLHNAREMALQVLAEGPSDLQPRARALVNQAASLL